jgi:hypothetical protein
MKCDPGLSNGAYKNYLESLGWRYTPVIPALGKLRQEDLEFETSLSYMVRPCLKNE